MLPIIHQLSHQYLTIVDTSAASKKRSFSGKGCSNIYELYIHRDEIYLLSAPLYSQRFYRHFLTSDLSMVKTFVINESEGIFFKVIACKFFF